MKHLARTFAISIALSAAICIIAAPAIAQDAQRVDVHRAQWHTFEGRTGCHMAHEIPGQGVALISHRHDGSEYLSFFANRPPREEMHGELHIANPPWGVETRERVEPIRLHSHPRTIRFSQRTTQRLLEALRDGQEPRIRYEPAYSDDRIAIGLTPAAFQQALEQYRACINRHERVDAGTATRGAVIPGRSGEPMADSEDAVWEGRLPRLPQGPRTEVFFATGSDGLTRDALERIEDFVRDVEDNPHWGVVLSIGYADTRGGSEINEQLARERAHTVRDQLIRLGLPGDRIEVEARLIDAESPERDLYDLAENRRVELRTAL